MSKINVATSAADTDKNETYELHAGNISIFMILVGCPPEGKRTRFGLTFSQAEHHHVGAECFRCCWKCPTPTKHFSPSQNLCQLCPLARTTSPTQTAKLRGMFGYPPPVHPDASPSLLATSPQTSPEQSCTTSSPLLLSLNTVLAFRVSDFLDHHVANTSSRSCRSTLL